MTSLYKPGYLGCCWFNSMALVIGQAGYHLYSALPVEAKAQVRDFILSLPGRAYEHRHEIIEYIKRLQQLPKRRGPDSDRDFPKGDEMPEVKKRKFEEVGESPLEPKVSGEGGGSAIFGADEGHAGSEEIECGLILSNASNNEEQMEHRLSNLEELCEGMEKMVTCLQTDVGMIHEYLNNAITRINDLHRCLNECVDKDLMCNEKMRASDDEFDLDDCSERIELKVQQLKKQ